MASKWPLPICETDSFLDSNLEKTAIYLDFSGKNGAQKRETQFESHQGFRGKWDSNSPL